MPWYTYRLRSVFRRFLLNETPSTKYYSEKPTTKIVWNREGGPPASKNVWRMGNTLPNLTCRGYHGKKSKFKFLNTAKLGTEAHVCTVHFSMSCGLQSGKIALGKKQALQVNPSVSVKPIIVHVRVHLCG